MVGVLKRWGVRGRGVDGEGERGRGAGGEGRESDGQGDRARGEGRAFLSCLSHARMHAPFCALTLDSEPDLTHTHTHTQARQIDPEIESKRAEAAKMAWSSPSGSPEMPSGPSEAPFAPAAAAAAPAAAAAAPAAAPAAAAPAAAPAKVGAKSAVQEGSGRGERRKCLPLAAARLWCSATAPSCDGPSPFSLSFIRTGAVGHEHGGPRSRAGEAQGRRQLTTTTDK